MEHDKESGKEHSGNHTWIMVIACLAPLALFIALPVVGLSWELILPVALVAMVLMHVWMMKGHSSHSGAARIPIR